MAQPEDRRHPDHLVEPLFAGLRDAESTEEAGDESGAAPRADPWKHPPRAGVESAMDPDLAGEPSTLRLFIKALIVMLCLIGLGAGVYLVFGV